MGELCARAIFARTPLALSKSGISLGIHVETISSTLTRNSHQQARGQESKEEKGEKSGSIKLKMKSVSNSETHMIGLEN